ncbi:sugar kinase [Lysobacter sp. 5GHs7-4]|uniref:sugar kinase n=1 Tax=Lysobacter sp. 5GHs7-4 TaxID=2904253 RepID=UPI0031BA4BF4
MGQRIVCFGELLLRLGAPGHERLLQSPALQVHVGGAEANVAVALSRYGHDAAMVGRVADNTLGAAAVAELRRQGVDTRAVEAAPGRMGLYFLETGAGHRPSSVLYDRADSAFARADADAYDWPALLAGADWLHLSGVTPALGQACADTAIAAARAARSAGVRVSFDGNFRGKLWQAWDGDAAGILRELMAQADWLFADHRDIAVALGYQAEAEHAEARFDAAARAAFAAFPQLRRVASTVRVQHSVDRQSLAALSLDRDGFVARTPVCELSAIVDRIGTGDAFAAGVLHGALVGLDAQDSLQFGWGAACLKHSVPGDFALFDAQDVQAFVAQDGYHVRR